MKKSILAVILVISAVFCAFGQNSGPIDLVLLLDTSSAMSSSYEKVNDYITGAFLSEFLRTGDTFHLITFSANPRLDIARRVSARGDIETIIGRMLIHYPVENGTDAKAAVSYAETYISSLPPRPKKIVMVSAGSSDTNNVVSAAKQRLGSKNATLDFVSVTDGQPLSNLPSSGRSSPSRQTSSQQRPSSSGTAASGTSGSATPPAAVTPSPSATQGTSQTGAKPATQSTSQTGTQSATQNASQTGAKSATQSTPQTGTQSATQNASQTGAKSATQSTPQTNAQPTAQGTSQTGAQSTAQGASQTGAKPATQSTPQTNAQSTAQGASKTGTQSTTQSTPQTNAQSTTQGASQTGAQSTTQKSTAVQDTNTNTTGTGPSAQGVSPSGGDKPASEQNNDFSGPDTSAAKAASKKQNDSNASFNPTLLLIIGIIAAILLLTLLLIFASRRLRSSPNRVMASASKQKIETKVTKETKFTDHSKDLANYAVNQNKKRVTPYSNKPVKEQVVKQPVINPTDPVLINLFVEDQSTSIGKRNIHSLKSGYRLSVGGGKSDDFLIFLVPMPANLGEISRSGSQITFTPHKPKYFPDIGSNEVRDCINKRIRVISEKNYEMWFSFVIYEDPLLALNQVLHSIKVPG